MAQRIVAARAEETARLDIEQQMAAAFQQCKTYLAKPNPSTLDNTNQVKLLTRMVMLLVRLAVKTMRNTT